MRTASPGKVLLLGLLVLAGGFALPGCYYGHLADGQLRVLWARRSTADVLADPDTPSELRQQLMEVERTRRFAADLGLDVGGQYTSYVPWAGDRLVTTLVVTEPGSVEARPFDFPIVGSVPYKGFFDQARAEREAETMRTRGLDVCLIPVRAYSTLGFFDDPLTDPMLREGMGRLVETVIHELVHATVFLKSQPDFNEGVATFVGQEGSVRFYRDDPDRAARRRAEVSDSRALSRVEMALRDRVSALYAETPPPPERAARRAALEAETRRTIAALPLEHWDAERLAERVRLNDACLALRGAYVGDLPRYEAVLAAQGDDLAAFVARLREAAGEDDPRAVFLGEPAVAGATGEREAAAGPDPVRE